jgi:peptide methionine sulfoxide reductase MsrA
LQRRYWSCRSDKDHFWLKYNFFWNTLEFFFATHDPTLNRQGNDVGTQCRNFFTIVRFKRISGLYRVLTQEKIFENQ